MSADPPNTTTSCSTRAKSATARTNTREERAPDDATLESATAEVSAEPEGDFTPIYTVRFVWSAKKAAEPLFPYEELTFKKSDHARLSALTVRWELTGKFSLDREEDIARGSLRVQTRRYLEKQGVAALDCVVNFPEGMGRNRSVDIRVPLEQFSHLKDAPLIFNKSKLQRISIGPAFPPNYLVIGIGNVPSYSADQVTARQIAFALQQYVAVPDIWVSQVSCANDPTHPANTNRWLALVSIEMETGGGIDFNKIHVIPGLRENDCTLTYIGRSNWCTSCKSQAEYFHNFSSCPHQR